MRNDFILIFVVYEIMHSIIKHHTIHFQLQLRKAYFQQANEIKALKEQLLLKNKRIQQLEDEMNFLRKGLLPKKDNSI